MLRCAPGPLSTFVFAHWAGGSEGHRVLPGNATLGCSVRTMGGPQAAEPECRVFHQAGGAKAD